MNSHIELISLLINNDTEDPEDQSQRLESLYEIATDTQKKAIDNALICICGYSFDTILNSPESISIEK